MVRSALERTVLPVLAPSALFIMNLLPAVYNKLLKINRFLTQQT